MTPLESRRSTAKVLASQVWQTLDDGKRPRIPSNLIAAGAVHVPNLGTSLRSGQYFDRVSQVCDSE